MESLQILVLSQQDFVFKDCHAEFNYSRGLFKFILYTHIMHVSSQSRNSFKSACLVMAVLQMLFVDKITCDKKHFPLVFMNGY